MTYVYCMEKGYFDILDQTEWEKLSLIEKHVKFVQKTFILVMITSDPACVNLKMLSIKRSTSCPSLSLKYSATVSPVRATRARAPGGSFIWPYTRDTWNKQVKFYIIITSINTLFITICFEVSVAKREIWVRSVKMAVWSKMTMLSR